MISTDRGDVFPNYKLTDCELLPSDFKASILMWSFGKKRRK
jgi:hypothetical protein